jgi:leader peptidase (prepilin peptidase)/N-methyltransferase
LLTASFFCGAWLAFGRQSAWLPLIYSLFLAGLIVSTFIDFEHLIIPDEITLGGIVLGFLCSFLLPRLHDQTSVLGAMRQSLLGIGVGAAVIYALVRGGKLFLGRRTVALEEESRIVFTETDLVLPNETIPYGDIFYRQSDTITLQARTVELVDRCYQNVEVRLALQGSPPLLEIGDEKLNPETVFHLEAVASEIVLPREAMGLGDVKFMAAIGAFLGWKAVVFSLMVSSVIGAVVGVTSIVLGKREWSSRLPYGPYIAIAATLWIFGGKELVEWWFNR